MYKGALTIDHNIRSPFQARLLGQVDSETRFIFENFFTICANLVRRTSVPAFQVGVGVALLIESPVEINQVISIMY